MMPRHVTEVATSTLKEHGANEVATTHDVATTDQSCCKTNWLQLEINEVATDHEQSRQVHVATST